MKFRCDLCGEPAELSLSGLCKAISGFGDCYCDECKGIIKFMGISNWNKKQRFAAFKAFKQTEIGKTLIVEAEKSKEIKLSDEDKQILSGVRIE